jgi:hypothetical protein
MARRRLSGRSHESGSSTSSSRSDASANSYSSALTTCSGTSAWNNSERQPSMYEPNSHYVEEPLNYDCPTNCSPRSSTDSVYTYASTVYSEEDLLHQPEFEVPLTRHDVYASDATPSTPADFAALFPSSRRLLIQHDDSTSDGNMNLRVDTEITTSDGRRRKLILFHLRMQDLRDRRFSLRRYCRESGREICSSNRTHATTPCLMTARSNIQHSIGHTIQRLRLSNDSATLNRRFGVRQDSGYDSMEDENRSVAPAKQPSIMAPHSSTNTIQLEFSNYAHVNVSRQGAKRPKRYEFEFWGTKYEWKRQVYRAGDNPKVSFHLINQRTSNPIAHITPDSLTIEQMEEEEEMGSWIPPCTLQITDKRVFRGLTDVAE